MSGRQAGAALEEKESETKSRGGWNGGASQSFLPEAPLETLHGIWAGARTGPAVGLPDSGHLWACLWV